MRAVAYVRTSTDDKGQDPERQMDLIRAWAAREGVVLAAQATDEGTSGSVGVLERPAFLRAVELAQVHGAEAVVVETVDRFTREGVKAYGWACVEVERRWGLDLWLADSPLGMQRELGGAVVAALKAELGKQWLERHAQAVRSGMARRRAAGARFGRPPKGFSEEEQHYILDARAAGVGWGSVTAHINEERGIHRLADVRTRKKRGTSRTSVQREHERLLAAQNRDAPKSRPQREEVSAGAE